jgi:hypothetical protein
MRPVLDLDALVSETVPEITTEPLPHLSGRAQQNFC